MAEVAAHLEDLYEEQLAEGVNETDAIRCALEEVTNWRKLARKIRDSKEQEKLMSDRTKKLWLPGFVSLAVASLSLIMLNRVGIEPRFFWHGYYAYKAELVLYLPWLMVLPVIGGVGAYLSRRANGEVKLRLVAALFPVLALLCVYGISILVSAVAWRVFPISLALTLFNWVLLPGVALSLGALPFLRSSQTREPAQEGC